MKPLDASLSSVFLIDHLPLAAYVCDREGHIVRFNAKAALLWGRMPRIGDPHDRFCGSLRMFGLDGSPLRHSRCPTAEVLRTGAPARDAEVVIERPDGSRITALVNIEALRDGEGNIVGAVNCLQDVTERQRLRTQLVESEKRMRSLLDALQAAVYLTDAQGKIVYFNEAAAELWGHRPTLGTDAWCGSWRLFWPDGRPMAHDECPMAVALKEGRTISGAEAASERPDGTRVPFLAFPTPLFDTQGQLVGGLNMLLDISDRKDNDQARQMLAALVESSQDAVVSKDLNGIIQIWNRGAERLFGYTAEEVVGKSVTILIPKDHSDEEPEILRRIRSGERVETYETVRQRKDGSLVDVSLTVSPVKDQSGRVVGASKIARDITERKHTEEQQRLLVREIKHRIKNTLGTVQAIARQTLGSASREELDAFSGRLQALGRAHDLLTSANWKRSLLSDVVDRATRAFDNVARERFVVDGRNDVWIDAEKSSGLTMALHELATNAIKYGALSSDLGRVEIAWETQPAAEGLRLDFRWQEIGGPPVSVPARRGFGSSLIERTLQDETSSTRMEFHPDGVRFTLEMIL